MSKSLSDRVFWIVIGVLAIIGVVGIVTIVTAIWWPHWQPF